MWGSLRRGLQGLRRNEFLETQLLECDVMIKRLQGRSENESNGILSTIDAAAQIDKLSRRHMGEMRMLRLRIEELEMENSELRPRMD